MDKPLFSREEWCKRTTESQTITEKFEVIHSSKFCFFMNLSSYKNDHCSNLTVNNSQQTGPFEFSFPEELVLAGSYLVISFLAFTGNLLVIWIIFKSKKLKQSIINHYVFNLALVDLVMGVFVVPVQIPLFNINVWPVWLPSFLCPLLFFVRDLTINVAVFTLMAIAYLRRQAFTHPFRSRMNSLSPPSVKLPIFVIWVVAVVVALPNYIVTEVCPYFFGDEVGSLKYHCNEWNSTTIENIKYYLAVWLMQYLVPVCIITYLYVSTSNTLQASNVLAVKGYEDKKRGAETMTKVSIAFAVCWFFVQTLRLLRIVGVPVDRLVYANVIWFICNWLAMSNSCYNPFIYAIWSKNFQEELKRIYPCFGSPILSVTGWVTSTRSSNVGVNSTANHTARTSLASTTNANPFHNYKPPFMYGEKQLKIHSPAYCEPSCDI